MACSTLPLQSRRCSLGGNLALLLTLVALQQQVGLSVADVSTPTVVRQPGKIAVDPTGGESGEGENELNTKGQLTNAGTNAPSGPAMLNGQRVTSANLNQKTPKAATATTTPATTATPITATPALVSAKTAGAQALMSSAANQQQPLQQQQQGGMFTTVSGGIRTAAQYVQQAPSVGSTRSAAVASGGATPRSGAQLSGSVTSVVGGRRMMLMVTPLRVVSSK